MISPAARRKQFERQQETQKQALRKRQAQSRNERAATLKAARRVELAKLSQEFQEDREAMKARHASEVAAQKAVWRQLAAEREKVWSDYRKEFAIPEPRQEPGQQQSHRDEFREAASGTANPERERNADKSQGALRVFSSMRWDRDGPFYIRPHFHVYVDALIQTAQHRHQAVNREPPDVRVANPGEIGGGNACQFRSLADRQVLAV